MVCRPVPRSTTPVREACPEAFRFTPRPSFNDVILDPTVSVKVTWPVGTVEALPAVVSVTVAVRVEVWPIVIGDGFMETAVAVVSGGPAARPLSVTCCVALARLRALVRRVRLALRLPATWGVNSIETSQAVPADSFVADVQRLGSLECSEKLGGSSGLAAKTSG